ncbi:unnamed protein product [Blumeria hordei]|uniref:Tubulin-specific chaperone A n=1 Tax=Blumeria hordei TaxID=2867405 RepID=A0A383UTJ7_BLUHO|nr:unnamed protein product [Blumeria hordei]
MPPPSSLAIATGALQRLIKEEASYHDELKGQEARLQKLTNSSDEDGNHDWNIRQERTAIEQTRAVFPSLKQRISEAQANVKRQLEEGENSGVNEIEVKRAKELLESVEEKVASDTLR